MRYTGHESMDEVVIAEMNLMEGCNQEAGRSDSVANCLDGLCRQLAEANNSHMILTIDRMRKCSQVLMDIAQLSALHQDRVPIVLDHLLVILPSLQKSLRTIMGYWEDTSKTLTNRWRSMYHDMKDEANMPLQDRFYIYKRYLTTLKWLLVDDAQFDLNLLNSQWIEVMRLREATGIPPPTIPVGELVRARALEATDMSPVTHWAKRIFSLPLSSRTALAGPQRSMAIGPFLPAGPFNPPTRWNMLFVRPFDNNAMAVIMYIDGQDGCPYLFIRSLDSHGQERYSHRGVHELCIYRTGSCLRLDRWSNSHQGSRAWALLYCLTWEELVLMHCTFLALKCRSVLTTSVDPREYNINREEKRFEAPIKDDDFTHNLQVIQDRDTRGIRLQASVYADELKKCPVWTAFVTHQAASPTWLRRTTRRRFRLLDIHLYVFCSDYQQQNQRRGVAGEFEINFLEERHARDFERFFRVP